MNKLYAFWEYDIFPTICSGIVTKIDDDGAVETEEYGKNYWFNPNKLVNLKSGKIIRRKLNDLEVRFEREKNVLYEKFKKERNEIIKL